MIHKNSASAASNNSLQEAAISYNTLPEYMKVVAYEDATRENYIQRSVALLGVSGIKPFNKVQSNTDFIPCIREGLPRKSLDALMEATGITTDEITAIIRTSDRTL